MPEQVKNNATTTLTASVNGSSDPVTFSVASASLFPTTGNFRVLIDSELLLVTSVSGTNFTATRASEGTAIASHSSGATVALILTAGSLLQLITENSSRPYPAFTPTGVDDEFDDNSFSGWTAVGSSPTPTVTELNGKASILHPGGGSAAQLYSWVKSLSLSVGEYIEMGFSGLAASENFPIFGLVLADGNTYNAGDQVVGYYSLTEHKLYLASFTSYNTFGTFDSFAIDNLAASSLLYLRLKYTASNTFELQMSCDRISWAVVMTAFSRTLTPTHVGFTCTKWGGTRPAQWALEYFRKGS